MSREGLKLVFTIFPLVICGYIDPKFIGDFFEQKGIEQIAMFGCQESSEATKFLRELSIRHLRLSYTTVNTFPRIPVDRFLKVNYYKLGVILDLECQRSENILQHLTDQKLPFNESYHWMMRTTKKQIPVEILETLPLSINSEITVAVEDVQSSYTLYDAYNPSYRHGGKLNITYMGYWNTNEGLKIVLTQYKYQRRADLNGILLNFSIVIDHPPKLVDMETYLTTPVDKHFDTMHRFNYALIGQLRDYYNFSINLMYQTTWGFKENGSFNGILGDMVKGIVDISVTPFRWDIQRLDVMEYTVQTWVAGPTVILRHPKKDAWSNEFFRPFSRTVWLLTTALAFIIWFLLSLALKIDYSCENNGSDATELSNAESALQTALIILAALCQQGSRESPQSYSGRIVFLSLLMWALMLYQFYSGSIVGSLLAAPSRFITTPQALLESDFELGAENISYNYNFFAANPDPIVAELNRKKLMTNKYRKRAPYFAPEEGLKKVQRGGFAFFIDVATAYKIIEDTFNEDEVCDLQEIRLIPPAHVATGTARHSPFKKMVTYGLRKIMERGMANRLRHVWHHRRPKCPESHYSSPTSVALKEFIPAILMLAYGAASAIVIVLLEGLICNYQSFVVKKRQQVVFRVYSKNGRGTMATIANARRF